MLSKLEKYLSFKPLHFAYLILQQPHSARLGKLHRLFESLRSLDIMGVHLRNHIKFLNTVVLRCTGGFRGALIWLRDACLSDSYTFDRCCFSLRFYFPTQKGLFDNKAEAHYGGRQVLVSQLYVQCIYFIIYSYIQNLDVLYIYSVRWLRQFYV